MVRFKVIKGSHLLLAISAVILLGVVLFVALQLNAAEGVVGQHVRSEAKVVETFASAVSSEIMIEIIPDAPPTMAPEAKAILIYHTHTHEAYEQDASDPYEAVETWRTTDQAHSVVRVGAALGEALTDMGFRVVHDVSDHEMEDLSNSYVRSLETLKSYREKFDLYIDLHRDAYLDGMLPYLDDGGNQYAQMMLLVGRGDKHSSDQRPNYEANLRFAQRLTSALNQIKEGIARNITVKTGRYNQHIGTPSILIEVGHNKNTLTQALNSVPVAAQAIASILNDTNF